MDSKREQEMREVDEAAKRGYGELHAEVIAERSVKVGDIFRAFAKLCDDEEYGRHAKECGFDPQAKQLRLYISELQRYAANVFGKPLVF